MVVAISRRKVYQIANRISNRMGTSKEQPGDLIRVFQLLYRYIDLTKDGASKPKICETTVNSEASKMEHVLTRDDVITLTDPENGQILYANTAAERFYGYTNKELLSMTAYDVCARPSKDLARDLKVQTMKKHYKYFSINRLSNGEIKEVEINTEPIVRDGRMMILTVIKEIPMAVAC